MPKTGPNPALCWLCSLFSLTSIGLLLLLWADAHDHFHVNGATPLVVGQLDEGDFIPFMPVGMFWLASFLVWTRMLEASRGMMVWAFAPGLLGGYAVILETVAWLMRGAPV